MYRSTMSGPELTRAGGSPLAEHSGLAFSDRRWALANTALWQSRCDRCCLRGRVQWRRSGPRGVGCLRGDVLVDVEEVAGVVGPFDLNQPVVVLPVVVPDLVIVVVL